MLPRLSSTELFWNWFTEHQDFLLSINEDNHQSILGRITKTLSVYSNSIFCNIVSTDKPYVFEMYFTAFGNSDAFDEIKELVAVAPKELSKNWLIFALIPPRREHLTIKLKSHFINTASIFFEYAQVEGEYYLLLGVKDLLIKKEDVDDYLIASLRTVVDSILGEEIATQRIMGYVIGNFEDFKKPIPLIDISDYIK